MGVVQLVILFLHIKYLIKLRKVKFFLQLLAIIVMRCYAVCFNMF